MKHILLILAILFLSTAGFSQPPDRHLSGWGSFAEKTNEQPELKIFPNPSTGQKLTVEISKDELTEIRITNIAGKVVMFNEYPVPVNKVQLKLDNTPNGIYLVQIKTSGNKIVVKKLIVSGR